MVVGATGETGDNAVLLAVLEYKSAHGNAPILLRLMEEPNAQEPTKKRKLVITTLALVGTLN